MAAKKRHSAKFLAAQRDALVSAADQYRRRAEAHEAEAEQLVSDGQRDLDFNEDGGECDGTQANRETLLLLAQQSREGARDAEAALRRIDSGTYGFCTECSGLIPQERLEALPGTPVCVGCKAAGFLR